MTDFAFIRSAFGEQKDKTQRYGWDHAFDVGRRLLTTLVETEELDPQSAIDLWRAAIGHDLLEDTSVTAAQLKKRWGAATLSSIQDLTNRKGDKDFTDYIAALCEAPEEVMLIKLCDIASNAENSLRHYRLAGPGWLHSFWLPLLEKYLASFSPYPFKKYPRSGNQLLESISSTVSQLQRLHI